MRKLNRPTDERMAVIKGLATSLLWYGKVETTLAKAKEVKSYAEKLLTLAINSYDDNELGSVMSTDYIEIKADLTIKQAMKAVINSANEVENINVIYVTDEVGKYVGIITLRDLIRARSTDLLEDIIKTNYPTLYDYSLLDEIDHDILDYELESYGVLDRRGLLIGIVNDETLIELVEEEYKEDYAMLAGISEIEDTTEPIYKSVLARLPWLAFLLVIGLLVSLLTSSFEKVILELTTVVFFQSLILGMAGNTGTQSLAVTISKLNDDEKKIGKVIKRELITGFLNGLIIAVIAFGLVMGFLLLRNEGMAASLKTALSVSISLIISMSIAAFLGAFVPYVLSKLKVDPAVASGPFITTINDIVAIIIYYSLASLLFTIL
jgi:magnesium transporter